MTALRAIPILPGQLLAERCVELYRTGRPRGDSTGWKTVDSVFTMATSQLTVVTGIPQSGKSEWLDALVMNLMETEKWAFAYYSPENFPTEYHLALLAEKRMRKPFGKGPNDRMTEDELHKAMEYVTKRAFWLDPEYPTYQALLDAAFSWRQSSKKFGIIIDPWNSLEHLRPSRLSETEYICGALTDCLNRARTEDAHIFIVAHPYKIQADKEGKRRIPSPYDISGSAHWYNRADNVLIVHRDQGSGSEDVEIHVSKVKRKHLGHIGVATLKYDRVTGCYRDGAATGAGRLPYRDKDEASFDFQEVPF